MAPHIGMLPGAMLRVDTAGQIVDINDAGRQMGDDFALDQNLIQLLDSNNRATLKFWLGFEDHLPDGACEFEVCIHSRRYRLSIAPRSCPDRTRFIQITDITEYRELSEWVAMNEQRYHSLLSQNPDAVCSLDLEGRLLESNHSAEYLTGYTQDQLCGNHWESYVEMADQEAAILCFETAVLGNPCSYRCKVRSRNGRRFVVQVTYMPILVDEQVVGVFAVARDKTEMYRLEESRRLLQACMAQVQDVIIITEMEPLNEPGPKIIYVNEGLERMTGYRPDEVLGRTPRIFQGPETDRKALKRIRKALEAREPIKEEVINYRKDGEPFWNEIEIVPISATTVGQTTYFASVQRDISQAKQRESALRHSQEELRRLSRAQEKLLEQERRRIARDLHDELGQTLTALKLSLGLVVSSLQGLPSPHVQRLEEMIEHVDGAVDAVREIASNLRPAMLDDLGFEATAEWFLKRCAGRAGLDVHWQADPPGEGRVKGEVATALFRILQECMTNISRHSKATSVTILYHERKSNVTLEVLDNGKGFDPGVIGRAGFGLVGIRERVAMLQGSLTVESAIGKGVRIRVVLPMEDSNSD